GSGTTTATTAVSRTTPPTIPENQSATTFNYNTYQQGQNGSSRNHHQHQHQHHHYLHHHHHQSRPSTSSSVHSHFRRFSEASTLSPSTPINQSHQYGTGYFSGANVGSAGKTKPPPLRYGSVDHMASNQGSGAPLPSGAMSPTRSTTSASHDIRPQLALTRKKSGFSHFMNSVLGSPKRPPIE